MVFGRKKKVAKVEEDDEEEYESDNEEDGDEEPEEEPEKENRKTKLINKPKVNPMARIISGRIISDGVFEYTLITNKALGELGSEFEI